MGSVDDMQIDYLNQIQQIQGTMNIVNNSSVQSALSLANSPAIQQANLFANTALEMTNSLQAMYERLSSAFDMPSNSLFTQLAEHQNRWNHISSLGSITEQYEQLANSLGSLVCLNTFDFWGHSNALSENISESISTLINRAGFSESLFDVASSLCNCINNDSTFQAVKANYTNLFSYYDEIFDKIRLIPEEDFKDVLEGTDYTRDDVLEDIKQFSEEMSTTQVTEQVIDVTEEFEKRQKEFLAKHPALAYVLIFINLIIAIASGIDVSQTVLMPVMQQAIVTLQKCDQIFFIKVDSAKVYMNASSHSEVIGRILYGEQVTVIESVNMWDKVIYVDEGGKEFIGWVAKRNLMKYQDWEFNSDDLYSMD